MSDDPHAPKTETTERAEGGGEASSAGHDVVLVHGRTDDGQGVKALRSRPGRLEAAEIRPVKEGQPLHGGELITINEREGSPLLWDVEVLHRVGEDAGRAGPAQVATSRYRRNWETIFGAAGARRDAKPGKKRRGPPDESTLN